jgi:hypothetical protein
MLDVAKIHVCSVLNTDVPGRLLFAILVGSTAFFRHWLLASENACSPNSRNWGSCHGSFGLNMG